MQHPHGGRVSGAEVLLFLHVLLLLLQDADLGIWERAMGVLHARDAAVVVASGVGHGVLHARDTAVVSRRGLVEQSSS